MGIVVEKGKGAFLVCFKEEEVFFSIGRAALRSIALLLLSLATCVPVMASTLVVASGPAITPLVSDWQFLAGGTVPPGQSACNAVGRRCFDPAAIHNSYNYASLLAAGNQG